jgi:hypothetical protein
MLLTRIPLFRALSEDSALPASQKIFGSLLAVWTTCHPVRMLICPLFHPSGRRQTKHHPSGRRGFPSGPFTVSRSFCSSLHPSRRISNRSSFRFFPSANMGRLLQPSRRLSAWSGRAFNRYGNCVFNFNRPDACLSWSGRALIRYGNCVLKINRLDGNPPWSGRAKPYMEVTCSGRATVRTTVPHRSDVALK